MHLRPVALRHWCFPLTRCFCCRRWRHSKNLFWQHTNNTDIDKNSKLYFVCLYPRELDLLASLSRLVFSTITKAFQYRCLSEIFEIVAEFFCILRMVQVFQFEVRGLRVAQLSERDSAEPLNNSVLRVEQSTVQLCFTQQLIVFRFTYWFIRLSRFEMLNYPSKNTPSSINCICS